jgi:hypothetical protein
LFYIVAKFGRNRIKRARCISLFVKTIWEYFILCKRLKEISRGFSAPCCVSPSSVLTSNCKPIRSNLIKVLIWQGGSASFIDDLVCYKCVTGKTKTLNMPAKRKCRESKANKEQAKSAKRKCRRSVVRDQEPSEDSPGAESKDTLLQDMRAIGYVRYSYLHFCLWQFFQTLNENNISNADSTGRVS